MFTTEKRIFAYIGPERGLKLPSGRLAGRKGILSLVVGVTPPLATSLEDLQN